MEGAHFTIYDEIGGEDSPNTVSESALDQNRPQWVAPNEHQRETQSNQSLAEWQRANPHSIQSGGSQQHRPQGGSSRRMLIQQIEQLENDKTELQARLQNLQSSHSRDAHDRQSHSPSRKNDEGPASSSRQSSSRPALGNDSAMESYPSTFASSNPGTDESQYEYLEQMVNLAGKLREALTESVKGVPFTLLDRPELKEMLLRATPHPERAHHYSHIFAKRSLELYKQPQNRSAMLQEGPLQKAFQHPRYVDILAKCIREPFIAHMGKFDEMEFCLWLVTETEYHPTEADEEGDEIGELDDSCYEFSYRFMLRFPFTGTKQLIENTNVWRKLRGEEAVVQTDEMKEAEEYTHTKQLEAAALPSQN